VTRLPSCAWWRQVPYETPLKESIFHALWSKEEKSQNQQAQEEKTP
jgi:hypothetical protein